MTDPRLLIPMGLLPPLPVGAPLVVRWAHAAGQAVLLCDGGDLITAAYCTGIDWQSDPPKTPRHLCALDLSPPDPPGSHVDGLDVGLRMLGYDVERGGDIDCGVFPHMAGVIALALGERVWEAADVPALAEIDYADPLALRLAVASVLRAGEVKP